MRRKYKNPPLVELVCEFRVPPECDWDLATPGLIYEKVRREFPVRKRYSLRHIELADAQDALKHRLRIEEHITFGKEDEDLFIDLGSRSLAVVSRVRPYPGWAHFRPNLELAFASLVEVSGLQKLRGLSLRYTNRIEVPDKPEALEKYFNFRPLLSGNEGMAIASFIGGTKFRDGTDVATVVLRDAAPDNPGNRAFLLLIDYSLAQDRTLGKDDALRWVEDAHLKVDERYFEKCIKPVLRREIFEEIR